jgi:tripeptidyl-peptidase II
MLKPYSLILLSGLALLISCGAKKTTIQAPSEPETVLVEKKSSPPKKKSKKSASTIIGEMIKKHKLHRYEDLVMQVSVYDAQKTAALIKKEGGKVIYDPNLGRGTGINFLIVSLTADMANDKLFIESLNLKNVKVEVPTEEGILPLAAGGVITPMKDLFIPINEIKIDQLRKNNPGEALGEDTIIGIIDTGVDPSHPAFQDRVVYWQDMMDEVKREVKTVQVSTKQVTIKVGDEDKVIDLPKDLSGHKEVYYTLFEEKSLSNHVNSKVKEGKKGLDINENKLHDDQFLAIMAFVPGSKKIAIFMDSDSNFKFENEELVPIFDFNDVRDPKVGKPKKYNEYLSFSRGSSSISFPLIVEEENNVPKFLTIGVIDSMHGTHVAGITAADSVTIQGAAPKAKIMSFKVCSHNGCSGEAIVRSFVDMFYNKKGIVPDVINMSMGLRENGLPHPINDLLTDLAEKFGTAIFISASNRGPGHATHNANGTNSPSISVGASASRDTLMKHYTLPDPNLVKENSMLSFSSLGPSYTGELRPNIMAPGSALSTTPVKGSLARMTNGTSMSSPLAAGAMSAMLSLMKKDPDYNWVLEKQKNKTKYLHNPKAHTTVSPIGTLLPIALAQKFALQESAVSLPHLPILVQGHGLMDIVAAHGMYKKKIAELKDPENHLFEVIINDNKGSFDRTSANLVEKKKFELSYKKDGERKKDSEFVILSENLVLKIEKVQEMTPGGVVTDIPQADSPIFIASNGTGNKKNFTKKVNFSNPYGSYFYSQRNLGQMKMGHSYTAHYAIYNKKGQRIYNFVDVVQKPIEFSNGKTAVDVPAINTWTKEKMASVYVKDVKIDANTSHRYPILVTSKDRFINVEIGIPNTLEGVIIAKVYNSKGKKGKTAVIKNIAGTSGAPPTGKIKLNTIGKPGIYEIVLSTSAGSFMAPTQYDMLVSSVRSGAMTKQLSLVPDHVKSSVKKLIFGNVNQVIPFLNADNQISKVEAYISTPVETESYYPVKVKSGHWSYRKINLPVNNTNKGKYTDITVDLGNRTHSSYHGRLDHRLYKYDKGDDKFEVVETGKTKKGKVTFSTVKRPKNEDKSNFYIALETFEYFPVIDKEYKKKIRGKPYAKSKGVEVVVTYLDVKLEMKREPVITVENSDPLIFNVTVGQATEIKGKEEKGKVVGSAKLYLDTDKPDVTQTIPVYFYY